MLSTKLFLNPMWIDSLFMNLRKFFSFEDEKWCSETSSRYRISLQHYNFKLRAKSLYSFSPNKLVMLSNRLHSLFNTLLFVSKVDYFIKLCNFFSNSKMSYELSEISSRHRISLHSFNFKLRDKILWSLFLHMLEH